MVTSNSSSVWLQVRFLASAPIFIFLLMFFLCVSAEAYSVSDNTLYDITGFPVRYSDTNSSAIFTQSVYIAAPTSSDLATTSSGASILIPGSPSASGSFPTTSPNGTYIDNFSPAFRFFHLSFSYPRTNAVIGFTRPFSYIYLYIGTNTTSNPYYVRFQGLFDSSGYSLSYSQSSGLPFSALTPYAYTVSVDDSTNTVNYDVYIAFNYNYYLFGLGTTCSRPSDVSSGSVWVPDFSFFNFEFSNSKILPPNDSGSGGSGGSVDLTPLSQQITALSQQMTSSFNQVNANIDAAESSITSSIEDQTTALEGAISDAADTVNDHFDTWNNSLSGAFSSSDAQAVVDANSAVSEMHQIEQDQIDDTQSALDDVDLSSYELPSDYSSSLSEIGNLFSLIFDSLGFISPLIIFSCSIGLASVLVGRKSRGDS